MRRLVPLLLGLAFVGTAAAVVPTTVLPRPAFPAPATGAGTNSVHFRIVSSTSIDPGRLITGPKPHGLTIDGEDGTTRQLRLRQELRVRLPEVRTRPANRAG